MAANVLPDDLAEDPKRFFQRLPEPELFFSNIPISETKAYRVKLFDVGNPVTSAVRGNSMYWMYKCELIRGFADLNLDHRLRYWMHFPARSFMIAWELFHGYRKIVPEEIMDCVIGFKRVTVKKMVIVERKYLCTDVTRVSTTWENINSG